MKSFRFSLQPIRLLRQHKEQDAQKRFAEAMRACEEAAFQLQETSENLASGWSALCEELGTGVSATRLRRTQAWCDLLESQQKERSQFLLEARRAMDVAWREMLLATREREALDRYHDKCRRAYDLASQRADQKTLDELGIRGAVLPGLLSSSRRFGKETL